MNREVLKIKVMIHIKCMYGAFSIRMKNNIESGTLYFVSEKVDEIWIDLPYSASEVILYEFKKTPEHKLMLDRINRAVNLN